MIVFKICAGAAAPFSELTAAANRKCSLSKEPSFPRSISQTQNKILSRLIKILITRVSYMCEFIERKPALC